MVPVIMAWVIVAFTTWRIIHLWAGTFWVDRCLREWVRGLIKVAPENRFDFDVIAMEFDRAGGHNAFMVFGVKSYRMTRTVLRLRRERQRLRALIVWAFQKYWRFFFYPLLTSAELLLIAFLSDGGRDVEIPVFIGFILLGIGCLGIVAEAYYAYGSVGTWATWYHRHRGHTSATFELSKQLLVAAGRRASDARIHDRKREAEYLAGTMAFVFFPTIVASLCAASAFTNEQESSAWGVVLRAIPDAFGFVRFDLPPGLSPQWALLAYLWLVLALALFAVVLQRVFADDLTPLD